MTQSETLYAEACKVMPGGVNSPVRAFKAVGGTPIYFDHALGAQVFDADGRGYLDLMSSWGAIILGHAHPAITEAVCHAAERGTSFGAPHAGEIFLAREVVSRMPGVELVRFVNSGTEASLAAIRLARAATGRDLVIKFEGNYHGAVDPLLARAGSGMATFGLPDSEGVPKQTAEQTLPARYNDLEHVRGLLAEHGARVAAVLVEPVSGNMGLVPPAEGFLEGLRAACTASGALLVMDEVMTGFRIARGGASERFGVQGDLTTMGKVIGGGLPVGAYGGTRKVMEMVAPLGPVYQAGTLSGNPLAMAAGAAALVHLTPEVYEHLEQMGARLQAGLASAAASVGVAAQVQRVGSMISVYFASAPVTDFDQAKASNVGLFKKVFHAMLARGVYLPPSGLEAWFLTAAFGEAEIDHVVQAFGEALQEAAA